MGITIVDCSYTTVVNYYEKIVINYFNYFYGRPIGQAILFSSSFFYLVLSFVFPRRFSAVGDWMSTILPNMMWP